MDTYSALFKINKVDSNSAQNIETSKLEKLLTLINRINSELELDSILASIMECAKDITDAEASSLMLIDEQTNELIFVIPTGPASANLSGQRIPSGKGFGGWVFQHNQGIIVDDVNNDERFLGDYGDFKTRNLVCVPLKDSKGNILGVLQAINKQKGNFSEEDLQLFAAFADQAAVSLERAQYQKKAIENERMQQELQLAQKIQEGLFPALIPQINKLDLYGKSIPARETGGDYFDFIKIDDNSCLVIVADISGKGVGASLVMVELRAVIRLMVQNNRDLKEIIDRTNKILVDDTPTNTFVTCFMALINTQDGIVEYVNAGHNVPWLVSHEKTQELDVGGPILGFMEGFNFEIGKTEFKTGDKLLIYTDGFSEGENNEEEQLGEEKLLEIFQSSKGNSKNQLLNLFSKLEEFVSGAEPSDDRTAVIVQMD